MAQTDLRPALALPGGSAPHIVIGCNGRGVQDSSIARPVSMEEPSIEEQFRLVAESGAFDYFDRLPLPHQLGTFQACIERHRLPVHTTSWFYTAGEDDALIARNLRLTQEVGAKLHNMMVYTTDGSGRPITNDEVVDCYLRSYDQAMALGVEPCFELHVNMWSEDPRRVTPVAEAVQRRGIPFHFTLDYSHVIFKMNNPEELAISGIREDVESGRLRIDPFEPGNLVDEWLAMGIVRWMQIRTVAPNGPRNLWAPFDSQANVAALPKFPSRPMADGEPGRSILYPFTRPAPGEWHSPWYPYLLQPSLEVVRKVLDWHAARPAGGRLHVTTEMITLPDYALNARFSLIGQNAAIARHARGVWAGLQGAA